MRFQRRSTMRQYISVIAKTDEALRTNQIIISFFGPRGGAQTVHISLNAARHLRGQLHTAIDDLTGPNAEY